MEHVMQNHVFLVTEDAYFFGIRSNNTETIVHDTLSGANEEISRYFCKRERESGYVMSSEKINKDTGMTEVVFQRYFGILKRKLSVAKKVVGK